MLLLLVIAIAKGSLQAAAFAAYVVVGCARALLLQLIACDLAGVFRKKSQSEEAVRAAGKARALQWLASSREYKPCGDARWHAEVTRLSQQGFALQELLRFYKVTLRERMPNFQPDVHKTVDVVRQAIIPECAQEKSALAVKMMKGVPTIPMVMVTHNWSNLFRDLVSAVLADALDDTNFDFIAELLDDDRIAEIETLLTPVHLARTYWVCAFSVNQHLSICHSNPFSTKDSLTQELHPVCQCDAQKYQNDSEPLRSDGKSIKCQMNKFDDMIALLSSKNPEFRQVVAVDRAFALFSRAWCVAELAAAHKMGMGQSLKIVSTHLLEEARSTKLQHLCIQDMEAARPEDVQDILSKIPDVDAFNARLHELLHSRTGLLAQWAKFDELAMIRRLSVTMTLKPSAELLRGRSRDSQVLCVVVLAESRPACPLESGVSRVSAAEQGSSADCCSEDDLASL
eukprot:TRINITY_DN10968_c0_g2_i1.p1 TRINITY_DN10968_c0_g2~~TRINITY_DN10968_c0_g2_i1.p1  ORF type:complete len:456 (-),score=79.89 TRINITY_DN10968_c0_g2_i1:345-1712(-)